jgi:hypothetical protein
MISLSFNRKSLSVSVAAAMLAGCGAPQPPIGAPGAIPQSVVDAPDYKVSKPLLFVVNTDSFMYAPVTVYDATANNPRPIVFIKRGLVQPEGDCVDSAGTLYVTDYQANHVVEYLLGKTRPFKTISEGLNGPAFCAIDSQGNLWVTNLGGLTVKEYLKGSTEPHFTIEDGLTYADGIAVDQAGTVYVGNLQPYTSSNVQVYAPGKRSPSRTITDGVRWPVGIAVDANRTLYVTNYNAPCNIEEYRVGDSHPFRELTNGLLGPVNLTVTKTGWLYVSDSPVQGCAPPSSQAAILEFPPGSLKPLRREITRNLHYPGGVAY